MYAIAIHGGAGAMPRATLSAERERATAPASRRRSTAATRCSPAAAAVLDAVATAVRMLEDDPGFNAGHGAALTRDGAAELDAAIMDGRQMRAGAVASVRHVRNPIELARRVMEKSRHVLLVGAGAEEFALEEQFVLVPNRYFRTAERLEQLEAEQRGERISELVPPAPQGTVGAVARDAHGNLAAATSTGGMTNKRPGRVGDSPIIGAGTYAKNGVCAVSATGHGEYFIRAVAAHHVCAAVRVPRPDAAAGGARDAARDPAGLGGDGGLIAVDQDGAAGHGLQQRGHVPRRARLRPGGARSRSTSAPQRAQLTHHHVSGELHDSPRCFPARRPGRAAARGARGRPWSEGVNYVRLTPAQQTTVPAGKVEVLEVFSYGCPACNFFQPVVEKLRPPCRRTRSWCSCRRPSMPAEDWPMFQRAYFAAQLLGVAERTQQADVRCGVEDRRAGHHRAGYARKLKRPAAFDRGRGALLRARRRRQRRSSFSRMANSFGVDSKMRAADAQIFAMQVDSTPTIIVNGKYRVKRDSLTSNDQLVELVKFLVAKESGP